MNKIKIGNFIENKMKEKDISIWDLHFGMGVSEREIKKWINGKKMPNMYDLEMLSIRLGVTKDDILAGEIKSKKNDDNLFAYVMEIKKKNRIKLIVSVILSILLIIGISTAVYFKNQSKVKIYTIDGESENFYYSDAMFITSKIKNIYIYGNIIPKNNNIKLEDINKITLRSGNRLIISSNTLPKQISVESYGYDELFPEKVVNNLDNWYLEISYNVNDKEQKEIIKLRNEMIMKGDKVEPISEDL